MRLDRSDAQSFAADFLAASREVAMKPEQLLKVLDLCFDGHDKETSFSDLLKAVIRLKAVEASILDALSSLPGQDHHSAFELYRDLSRSAIMVSLIHDEKSQSKALKYYPHLLTSSDIERIKLNQLFGMGREDAAKALEVLDEVQERLSDRLGPKR